MNFKQHCKETYQFFFLQNSNTSLIVVPGPFVVGTICGRDLLWYRDLMWSGPYVDLPCFVGGTGAVSDKLALAKKLAEKIQMRNKDETQQAAENFLNKGIVLFHSSISIYVLDWL